MRVIRVLWQEKREIENFQVLNQVYTAIQMKTGYWSSLLTPLDLFDRQWNFAGDYLEWLYFYPERLAQSRCLDCLNQLSPANLGELIKLAMLINSLNQSYISAKRINEVFAEKPEDILAEIVQKNFLEPVLTS